MARSRQRHMHQVSGSGGVLGWDGGSGCPRGQWDGTSCFPPCMSRATLGAASMELQGTSTVPMSQHCPCAPLCHKQCCSDGRMGPGVSYPAAHQEPALLPSLLERAMSGAGAGHGAGASSRKWELESAGLITAGNRSPEPSELLIPPGSFCLWLLSHVLLQHGKGLSLSLHPCAAGDIQPSLPMEPLGSMWASNPPFLAGAWLPTDASSTRNPHP